MNADNIDITTDGQDSVQALTDTLLRDQAIPRVGLEPAPSCVVMVICVLLLWGGYYLGTNAADFRYDVYDTTERSIDYPSLDLLKGPEPDPQTVDELMKIGATKYFGTCLNCHKIDGNGDIGDNVPPLNGSEWVAGLEASPARLSRIVLYGLHQPILVKGRQFPGKQMPPNHAMMRDYEIAGVITYIRNTWSNKADPDNAHPAITVSIVKAARSKCGKRDLMTASELLSLPIDYKDSGE
jgi:mono/diheme cytochrome c family protein